jgi:hypothetical protein
MMDRDHEPLELEIRNAGGELMEPPDGVSYSATYRSLDGGGPTVFDPSGSHSCAFCTSRDWRWILRIRPSEPDAEVAWAANLVACDTCQQLCRGDQIDALRERIVQETGADWILEYLDDLLDRIIGFHLNG